MTPDAATTSIRIGLRPETREGKDEDIWYILVGDAEVSGIAVILTYVFVTGFLLIIGIYSYAFFSGGMQWILVLSILSVISVIFILLIRRGMRKREVRIIKGQTRVVFTGELAELTDTIGRGKVGYSYSQQLVRERIAEAIVDRIRAGENFDSEEILKKLKEGDTAFIGNKELARFLIENKKELSQWYKRAKKKRDSKERGRIFMIEIDNIMKETEAML